MTCEHCDTDRPATDQPPRHLETIARELADAEHMLKHTIDRRDRLRDELVGVHVREILVGK